MDKYELDDIIFNQCCEVLSNNDNWIEYGDFMIDLVDLQNNLDLIIHSA